MSVYYGEMLGCYMKVFALASSTSFCGSIRFKNITQIKSGANSCTLNDYCIDVKDIASISKPLINASFFAEELALPNLLDSYNSFKKSIEALCNSFSYITLLDKSKFKVDVSEEQLQKVYNSALENDSVFDL